MKNNKGMKKFGVMMVAIMALASITGCEKTTKEATSSYDLPEGMQDCKIYYMSNENGHVITVVRCPLSSTTTAYKSGKINATTTVVEKSTQIPNEPTVNVEPGKNNQEVEIDGETYRKSESMKQIQVNGETYTKM